MHTAAEQAAVDEAVRGLQGAGFEVTDATEDGQSRTLRKGGLDVTITTMVNSEGAGEGADQEEAGA